MSFKASVLSLVSLTFLSSTLFGQSAILTGQTLDVPITYDAGVNYVDDATVALVLRAPGLTSAEVIGEFNAWDGWEMNNSIDGEWWWIEITGLTAGEEYAYQYLTDGVAKSADPFSDKILDPWNDQYIDEETYPGLRDYPDGKNSGDAYVSVFEIGQEAYNWKVTDFDKPNQSELNIYELLIRDFDAKHSFDAVVERLDYLQMLGVNAVELMPVQEFDGNISWGYNPNFYFAVDKYYGTKEAFKNLIDQCHMRGMAVIMDVVYNFSWSDKSPYINMYIDQDLQHKPLKDDNPMYNVVDANTEYSWGTDINHESAFTKWFFDKVNKYWVEEFKIDGFRYDFAKGFTQTSGDQGAADESRKSILQSYADEVWSIDPDTYMILEYFVAGSEEIEMAGYSGPNGGNGFMPWVNLHGKYSESMLGWSNADLINQSWADYKVRGWDGNGVVYFSSHDEERQMWRNYAYGNGTAKDSIGALGRNALTAAYFFALPGAKMIYQFDELGYDYCINWSDYWGEVNCGEETDQGRTDPKPIRWDYYEEQARLESHDVYAQIMRLRNKHTFMHADSFVTDITGKNKFIKIVSDTNVVFLANFNVGSASMATSLDPIFSATGWWYEYFSGDSLNVTDQNVTLTFEGSEFRLYTNYKLDQPLVNTCESELLADLGSDTLLCSGSSIQLHVAGAFEAFIWDGTSGTADFTITEPGTYSFKGVDSSGCFANDRIVVRATEDCGLLDCSGAQDIDLGADTVICAMTTIGLSVASDYSNVIWNGEFGADSYVVREPENIEVVAEDAAGCIVSGSIDIAEREDCSDLFVNEEITINVHLEGMNHKMGCSLDNTDDFYVHMGVCIDNATDCADPANLWKHVVGNWGADDGIGKMTQDGTNPNVFSLTLDPDIYFTSEDNLSDPFDLGSTVYSVSMVIRSADGSSKCPTKGDLYSFDIESSPSQVVRIDNGVELDLDSIVEINNPVSYTGVGEALEAQQLAIYPNPASAQATIVGEWKVGQLVNVTVRNSIGQMVLTDQMTPSNGKSGYVLDIESLSGNQGLYLVNMTQDGVVTSARVVFE